MTRRFLNISLIFLAIFWISFNIYGDSGLDAKKWLTKIYIDLTIISSETNKKVEQKYLEILEGIRSKIKQLELARQERIKSQENSYENTIWERLLMDGRIISREEWWADESLTTREVYMKWCEDGSCFGTWSTWPTPKNELLENYLVNFNEYDKQNLRAIYYNDWKDARRYYPVDRIVVHHTASEFIPTKQEWLDYMNKLLQYHAVKLRWSDIWYHYLIDGDWNIYEWRAGGKYVLGAHVSSHNFWTVGISLMSSDHYSPQMLSSLKDLIIYLWDEYNLDLTQDTTIRANDLSWWVQGPALIAHKELDSRKPYDPMIDMDILRREIRLKILADN